MIELELVLRWLHVIGASVLLGTGAGIAFFMLMAWRTQNVALIAHTAGIVVVADFIFTTLAVIAQPVSGTLLAIEIGWSLSEPWLVLSMALYGVTGVFWVPVVFIQIRLRNLARDAMTTGQNLPRQAHRLFAIWFACGFPAFFAVLTILWLMLARPEITL